jgi:Tfp pilus assembly protein PilO
MSDVLVPLTPNAPVAAAESVATPNAPLRAVIEVQAVPTTRDSTRQWIPTLTWALRRTGNRGLIGLALLGAALVFLFSTHLPLVDDLRTIKDDLAQAQQVAAQQAIRGNAIAQDDPRRLLESLPVRNEVPQTLRVILAQANEAGLSLDTGKYDIAATRTGAITRYNISLPVSGSYAAIRTFIDHTLAAVPSAAIAELAIERKSIAEGIVEANIRLTLFTRGAP